MGPSDDTVRIFEKALGKAVQRDEFPERGDIEAAFQAAWPDIIIDTNRQMAEFQQAMMISVQQRYGARAMRYVVQQAERILRVRDDLQMVKAIQEERRDQDPGPACHGRAYDDACPQCQDYWED